MRMMGAGFASGFGLTMAMAYGGFWPQALSVPIVSTLGLMALKDGFRDRATHRFGAARVASAIEFLGAMLIGAALSAIAQIFHRGL